MAEPPAARLLDVTRLASRAGRGLTGVDRVERAYLSHLVTQATPLFGLARTVVGYVILDRAGLAGLLRRVDGAEDWGRADRISRLARRLTPMQQRADADLRRLAVARSTRIGLGWLLRRRMPEGTAYLNIGHSNLGRWVLRAARGMPGGRVTVFVHDTIPLDLPAFQRPGTELRFRETLERVGRHSDLLIFNSERTRRDVQRVLARWNLRVRGVVAHLGVEVPPVAEARLPGSLPPGAPYFVTVGTIEPRKNIGLLLDVWDDFGRGEAAPPHLLICGARGWQNEDVLARLDALPPGGPVHECHDLSDPELAALIRGARALLQPSFAEGFGLPPVEAAALGTPVVCSDLPVYREVLRDIPVYLSPEDRVSWADQIMTLAREDGRAKGIGVRHGYAPPTWQAHFNIVLRMT